RARTCAGTSSQCRRAGLNAAGPAASVPRGSMRLRYPALAGSRCGAVAEAASLQLERHEVAVGIHRVVAKRRAVSEPVTRVEPARRGKELLASGLEAEAPVAAPPRLLHEVGQHRSAHAGA